MTAAEHGDLGLLGSAHEAMERAELLHFPEVGGEPVAAERDSISSGL
jgi:hypothetical protein